MEITAITNPVYATADHSMIDCTITLDGEQHPFTAYISDPEAHGQEIYADIIAGKYGDIGAYVAPTITVQQYQVGAQALLDKSDLVALRCFKAGVAFPAEWRTYSAALRAIVAPSWNGDVTQAYPTTPSFPAGT